MRCARIGGAPEATVGLAGNKTAIGEAIGLAVKRLRERPAESRVMVLLTDGANTPGGIDPLEAARLAGTSDIRIHTIGIGAETPPGTVFERAFGTRRAELDETTLAGVAEATGGTYFRCARRRASSRASTARSIVSSRARSTATPSAP